MTPAASLLLRALRTVISEEKCVDAEPLDGEACRALVDLAVDARLSFQVHAWLQSDNKITQVSSECVKKLWCQVREAAARNTLQRVHARQLLERCAQRGVPLILTKGLWLADHVYRDPGARDACDIDLLLRPEHVPAFTEVARELGFEGPRAGTHLASYAGRTNEFLLQHRSGVQLDVHWGITHPVTELPVDEESLWRRAEVVQLAGSRCLTLNLEDHLLYLCFHAAVHHQFWALGPRCLCDIAMVLRQPPRAIRWDELVGRAKDLGWERPAWLMFSLVQAQLGAAPPDAVMRDLHIGTPDDAEISRTALGAIFAAQVKLGPHRQLALLLAARTWRQKAAVVRHLLVPSRIQMTNQFGNDIPLWRLHLRRWCTKGRALFGTVWMLLRSPGHRAELEHTNRIQSWLFPDVYRSRKWTPSQLGAAMAGVLVLPVFAVLLRCMTLPRLLAWIEDKDAAAQLRPAVEEAAALARAVNVAAARGPWPVKCLTRSLVLHWLLRRRHIASVLRLGVARVDGFRAHAWVECGGVPVNDRFDVAKVFSPFESIAFEPRRWGP